MSGRRIAVSLSKGGTGKSTTATNLAHGLALSGSTVLLIDTDTQGQVAQILGKEPTVGLAELIAETVTPNEALYQARDNLWILAGGRQLGGVKRLIAQKEFGSEKVMVKSLSSYNDYFDYIIVDTSPGWDALTINVLFYVQEVLSPVSLEVLAIKGLVEFEERMADIQEYHTNLKLRYVVPTFLDGRVKKSGEIWQQLKGYYTERLCQPIRYNVRLSEAPGYGQTIFEYAPGSPGAEDYQALVKRVKQDE